MKFREINTYKNLDNDTYVEHINRRLEYFHHYWNFLFQGNSGGLFITDEKFESHRSLFHKINIQLLENPNKYRNPLTTLFIGHPYFKQDNVILRKSTATNNRIQNFSTHFRSLSLSQVKAELKNVEKAILRRDYAKRILAHLVKLLHQNKPLNNKAKTDLKFLINATIIELYYFGYSRNILRKIPDIILFPHEHKFDFPFDKSRLDFKNEEEHKQYVENELIQLNLNKQISGLLNLINRPQKKGFYIFKIEGVEFKNKEPVKIWNTTFYNPEVKLMLNHTKLSGDWKDYVIEMETYFDDYVKDSKKEIKVSTCNAIIEVEYHRLFWDHSSIGLESAYNSVTKALNVLKKLNKSFNGNDSQTGNISRFNYIITDENKNYLSRPTLIWESTIFEISPEQQYQFGINIELINKLDHGNDFHNKLINIYFSICRFRIESHLFNFKDSWTVISEALFPNDIDGFIGFCKKSFRHRLKKNFLVDVKCFLSSSLRSGFPFGPENYVLSNEALKDLDLYILLLTPIKAKRFRSKYPELKNHLQFDFLDDIINELDFFINNEQQFLGKIEGWIEKTIYQIYAERNLETHNNIQTNLSLIKLKESFLYIANTVLLVCMEFCNKRTKSMDDIERKL